MPIYKCSECGNTFKADHAGEGEIVSCPVCEANYKIQIKDGRIKLNLTIYEEDQGEL